MARFGEILAELRQDRGLTQETLARVLFVTAGTISNYENNAHFPDIEKLTALADFFDVPLDYLLGRCASSLPPGTLDEPLVPGVPCKSAGRVIAEIRALPPERQRALLQILHDMTLATAAERRDAEQNHSLGSTGGTPAAAYPWKR